MPAKRSTRFTVKHFAKQVTKHFAMKHFGMKHFGMKHFTVKRPMAIGIIFVCIVGTAMLIVARSSEPTSAATIVPEQATVALAPNAETPVAKAPKPFPIAATSASAQTAGTVAGADLATIEGCLVQDNDQFQLKNTTGGDAPRGRSWKSGFLHKGSKTIDVLDQTHRLNLARHVGERVTITGILDDRDLQGTSLKRVAESCG
jgi:hypothetical protein